MLSALSAATVRGVAGGVLNLSRDMLTSLLDVAETPTVLSLSDQGRTKKYDVFEALVHLLSAIPTVVPTERQGDNGLVLSEKEIEDQKTEEAAAQLMASA